MEQLSKSIVSKTYKKIKVMQFGEGNFLRAFVDWIIQKMNDSRSYDGHVVVVQPMPFGRVADLVKQDGLYTLYLQGIDEGKVVRTHQVIDVIDDLVNPFTEYEKYLSYGESEDLETIISNTTEAGISLDANDLDFSKCPTSFPGKLLALLHHRYEHFNGDMNKGLMIIPCELIDNNGDVLKQVMLDLAKLKGFDESFLNWLENACHYTSTLVDRIVPGYPRDEINEILAELGYEDNSIVKGEIFHLWCLKKEAAIQEKFPADKAGLNVIFADSIKPYKQRKVKVLNGAHTCLVPVSYLYGIDTVKESIEDQYVGKFVKDFIFDEVVPTIELPHDQMVSFANSVLERFLNPFVRHELMSIALNSVSKFKERVLRTILDYIEINKTLPTHALFSMASLICFYRGYRGEQVIALKDNQEYLDAFKQIWSCYEDDKDLKAVVTKVLAEQQMWGLDLNTIEGFNSTVHQYLEMIIKNGMPKALKEFLEK